MATGQEPIPTEATSQQQTVVRVFDRFSGDTWDALYDDRGPQLDNWKFIQRKLRVEELLANEKPGSLLDVGCGTGPMAPTFLQRGWEFHGLDIAPKMIEHARHRFAGDPRARFYVGKIEQANFESNHFDAVIAMGLLEYLNDAELAAAMKEMARVLKPSGVMIISVIQPHSLDSIMRQCLALPTRFFKPLYLKLRGKKFDLDELVHRQFSVAQLERLMADVGCVREDHAYYNLVPLPFPFDKLLPRLALAASRWTEPKQHDHFHWAATACMLKARKKG
ncbi:MAG: methyltransferase domain-containing protein [Verrucomicrobia bacterium]|nr:methyltransferase domain-containing protein [Verrucomicrobiota bacterium]